MSYNYKGKRVFISGPMTGRPDWNRAEFDRAERELREMGAMRVFNPAFLAPGPGSVAKEHEFYMAKTLNALTRLDYTQGLATPYYDVLALLDGWEDSAGARIEAAVATAIGLDVVEFDELEYL